MRGRVVCRLPETTPNDANAERTHAALSALGRSLPSSLEAADAGHGRLKVSNRTVAAAGSLIVTFTPDPIRGGVRFYARWDDVAAMPIAIGADLGTASARIVFLLTPEPAAGLR